MRSTNVDLRKLHHALVLAETGGFTAAAARLNLTQSALSRSIQALEQQLGLVIFERGRNGASPTIDGRDFLARARDVYGATLHLERFATDLARGIEGEVTLGLGTSVSHAVLPRLVARIAAEHPRLSLIVRSEPAAALIDALASGRCDLVYVADTPAIDRNRVSARAVMPARPGILVRAGHPLLAQGALRLADLADSTLVSGPVDVDEIRAAFGPGCRLVICDDPVLLRDLVLRGDALWLTQTFVAADDLNSGRMAMLEVADVHARSRYTIYELAMRHTRLSRSADLVAGLVREELDELSGKL